MRNIWFISDPHFGHENILTFQDENRNYTRPFATIKEHDEHIIDRWNSVVGTEDYVYLLGDVAFKVDTFKKVMPRLKGSKRLIVGNHDEIKKYDMVSYFKKINLWRVFREYEFTCTHIPLAPENCKTLFNVHGHIHHNTSPNPMHINVSCEAVNYTPLHLDEILKIIEQRKQDYPYLS